MQFTRTWRSLPWIVALICATANAQELPESDEPTPVSPAFEIPDEPRGVDPTPFLPAALTKQVTVEFREASLDEVFEWLEQESGLPVEVSTEELEQRGISTADLYSDHLTDQPIFLLLDRLRRVGIDWIILDEVMHIISTTRCEMLTMETYNLGPLLDAGYERESLLDTVLQNTVGPWEFMDGIGGSAVWLGDVLFVRQGSFMHRELQTLFAGLMKHGRQTYLYDLPINQELRDLMEKKIDVAIDDMPLELAVRELATMVGADMRIDVEAFKSAGVSLRKGVTVHLQGHSLRTVLNIMLKRSSWVIRDGVIWITTDADADEEYVTAIYDVRDLSRNPAEGQALAGTIMDQTAGPWEEIDGLGGRVLFPRHGTMIIRQNRDNHDHIRRLLDLFRKSLLASKPRPVKNKSGTFITRYYRMPLPMAKDVQRLLPLLVRPETWNHDQPGRIILANSEPDIRVPKAATPFLMPSNTVTIANDPVVTPQAVLIVRHTRAAHVDIAEFISHIRYGDQPQYLGGGFGSGFFAVPDRVAVPVQQ